MDIRAFVDKMLKNKFLLGLLTGAAIVFAIWGCVAAFQNGGGRGSDPGDEAGFLTEEAGEGSGDEGHEQPRAPAQAELGRLIFMLLRPHIFAPALYIFKFI